MKTNGEILLETNEKIEECKKMLDTCIKIQKSFEKKPCNCESTPIIEKNKVWELIIITPTENIKIDCIKYLKIDEICISKFKKEYHVYDLNKSLAMKISTDSKICDIIAVYNSW